MRCLNCNWDELATGTEVCPGCGVHLPTLLRDALPAGTMLHHDKYRIKHALGWGGFGITYLAEHISLAQVVAVKEFYPRDHVMREGVTGRVSVRTSQKDSYERALRRFVREGQTLAQLDHPGIVRVRDQFEENGTAYLVMDYISPARTLREELDARASRRFSEGRVREIAAQLVSALEAVHEKGIYHLDVKPENVLLKASGQSVLIDFGASRQGLGTKTTQAFTLEYAAPEVVVGGEVGPESDIFELGMMLHEMLTGERPPAAFNRLMKDEWSADRISGEWKTRLTSALRLQKDERPRSVGAWWRGEATTAEAVPTVKLTTPPPSQPAPKQESQPMAAYKQTLTRQTRPPAPLPQTEKIIPPVPTPKSLSTPAPSRKRALVLASGGALIALLVIVAFAMSGSDETPGSASGANPSANVSGSPGGDLASASNTNASMKPLTPGATPTPTTVNKNPTMRGIEVDPALLPQDPRAIPFGDPKGTGTGVGSGDGRGYGPGRGENTGGGDTNYGGGGPGGGGGGGDVSDYSKTFTAKDVNRKAVITFRPEPGFTEEARKNNVTGVVTLRMVLGANGQVSNIQVVKGLPDGLTERAVAAARRIRFTPAQKDGRAVSQWISIQYDFNIY